MDEGDLDPERGQMSRAATESNLDGSLNLVRRRLVKVVVPSGKQLSEIAKVREISDGPDSRGKRKDCSPRHCEIKLSEIVQSRCDR